MLRLGGPSVLGRPHAKSFHHFIGNVADCQLSHTAFIVGKISIEYNELINTKSPSLPTGAFLDLIGRRPTLPHTRACSTIGAEGLNFRVRDGNGWDPFARITQNLFESLNI